MDPERLAQSITATTRAVCFVDFSGHTGPALARTAAICRQRGVPLIEDAACAVGQRHDGRSAGSFGAAGVYSFSVPKLLTTGQGGALLTNSTELFESAARLIDNGDLEWRGTNLQCGIGSNLRFNDLSAALGLVQFRDLDALLARKRAVHQVLREKLGTRVFQGPGDSPPLHNIVYTAGPQELVERLHAQGIMATRQYRTISQHPAYTHLAERSFPNADYWTEHAVFLPFGMSLTPEEAARMADAVLAAGTRLEDVAG